MTIRRAAGRQRRTTPAGLDPAEINRKRDASRAARGKRRGSTSAYRKAREIALQRDQYRCRVCGGTGGGVQTHHVNGNAKDDRPENLVTLCRSHHDELEAKKRNS